MLEFSDVSIIHNKTTLLYVVKIPNLEETECQNYLIKPIIKNNVIVNTELEEILESKENMYRIIKICKDYNNIKICDKNNIVNLRNRTCLPRLLKGKQLLCEFSNADQAKQIEERPRDAQQLKRDPDFPAK